MGGEEKGSSSSRRNFFRIKLRKKIILPESSFGILFKIGVSNKDFSCNWPFFNSHTAAIGELIAEDHIDWPDLSNANTTPVCNWYSKWP